MGYYSRTVNALRWSLPPMIIFKGVRFIEAWFSVDVPSDWRIEVSESGWTTDAIGVRWLGKLFIPITASRRRGRYRLLVLDGHGSYLTPEFDQLCAQPILFLYVCLRIARIYYSHWV